MSLKISEKKYWESIYTDRELYSSPVPAGYIGVIPRLIVNKISEYGPYNSIIEFGAGGSDWLIYLCKHFKPKKVTGLDYTEKGCAALLKKSQSENLNIKIIKEDLLTITNPERDEYDLVFTSGLVEHFSNLRQIIFPQVKFLSSNGIIITMIPNMAGLTGKLVKILDKEIYDIHIPYDLEDLVKGHIESDLEIIESGYLGFHNHGVLSACNMRNNPIKKLFYYSLAILGHLQFLFEHFIRPLPPTKMLSPYIYVIGKKNESMV